VLISSPRPKPPLCNSFPSTATSTSQLAGPRADRSSHIFNSPSNFEGYINRDIRIRVYFKCRRFGSKVEARKYSHSRCWPSGLDNYSMPKLTCSFSKTLKQCIMINPYQYLIETTNFIFQFLFQRSFPGPISGTNHQAHQSHVD